MASEGASNGENSSSNSKEGMSDPIESDNTCNTYDGKTHQRLQRRNKKYQCKVCDKYFVTPSKLKRHFRTHWRETLSVQNLWAKICGFK